MGDGTFRYPGLSVLCYGKPDTSPLHGHGDGCIRSSVMVMFSFLTLSGCIIVWHKTQRSARKWLTCRQIIIYLTAIELLVSFLHFAVLPKISLAFIQKYAGQLQYASVCAFMGGVVLQIFQKSSALNTAIFRFCICVIVAYQTIIFSWSMSLEHANCQSLVWMLFACSEVVLSLSLVATTALILWRLARMIVVTRTDYCKKKMTQLCLLSAVFFTCATTVLGYELLNYHVVRSTERCDVFFRDSLGIDTVVYIFFRMCDSIFPAWIILFVFYYWSPEGSSDGSSKPSYCDLRRERALSIAGLHSEERRKISLNSPLLLVMPSETSSYGHQYPSNFPTPASPGILSNLTNDSVL